MLWKPLSLSWSRNDMKWVWVFLAIVDVVGEIVLFVMSIVTRKGARKDIRKVIVRNEATVLVRVIRKDYRNGYTKWDA